MMKMFQIHIIIFRNKSHINEKLIDILMIYSYMIYIPI